MPKRYFTKFPEVNYNGYLVKDITRSAKLVDKYVNIPYNYYRFELDTDQRADQVADSYYDDPAMTWIIYYANKTVDPYYGWFLSDADFEQHLEQKYPRGLEEAKTRIACFRTNWYDDDRELSPSQFEAQFGEYKDPHSKYWDPVYNEETDRILAYRRKASDLVVNTNKIVKVQVANNSPSKFSEGDLVDIKAATNGSTLGTAEVLAGNTTVLYLKNVLDNVANAYFVVQDSDPTVHCQISAYSTSNDVTGTAWTQVNIDPEEFVYWSPVYFYDMEVEANQAHKTINLVDPAMAVKISDKLEDELSG